MKFQPRSGKTARIAGPILLALLLTAAVLPGAVLANTLPPPVGGSPTPPPTDQENTAPPVGGAPTPPPTNQDQNTLPPSIGGAPTPPAPNQDQDTAPPGGGSQQETASPGHPDAPAYPSADCIVTHAATPAQICPIAGGLQYYFIGKDGSAAIGPFISSLTDLAALYTGSADVLLYAGLNPLTGKSVSVHYLTSDRIIRVSTYYPDTRYDTDKPYTFTINGSNAVSHIAW